MPGIMARPKFARDIQPSFSGEPEAGCCGATACVEGNLRNDACRCMPGEAANSRMRFSRSGAMGNHSASHRIPKPRAESNFIGWMIDKIFMKRRRNQVFNGRFYDVGGESRAQSFPETGNTAPIISWVAEHLSDSPLRDYTADPSFPESGLLPVISVWMRFLPGLLNRGRSSWDQN